MRERVGTAQTSISEQETPHLERYRRQEEKTAEFLMDGEDGEYEEEEGEEEE